MIILFGFLSVTLVFIYYSEIEESCSILLFINRYFEIMYSILCILLLIIIQDADVEIGFKIFRISFQSFLIVRQTLIEMALIRRSKILDA